MEQPIIFQDWAVRAILEGKKTQTRQVIKPQPSEKAILPREWGKWMCHNPYALYGDGVAMDNVPMEDGTWGRVCSPYGLPGDWLWVREALVLRSETDFYSTADTGISSDGIEYGSASDTRVDWAYRADDKYVEEETGICPDDMGLAKNRNCRPSIHMPKWAARLWLKITDVRVERVQDISEVDAVAEGIDADSERSIYNPYEPDFDLWSTDGFRRLWNTVKASSGYGWDANPWVWVIEFEKCEQEGE